MEEVIVKQNVMQAIANYLATKPYNEVAGIMEELKNVKVVEKEETKPEEESTNED